VGGKEREGSMHRRARILACVTGVEGIPAEWLASRESLPTWHLEDGQIQGLTTPHG